MPQSTLETPLGPITVTAEAGLITRLDWRALPQDASDLTREAAAQLQAYFAGKLIRFDLPLTWGNGLNEQVRRAMAAIPLGQTRTYGDLARDLHAPAQAIGQACGLNPIPIIIPCHRILGAHGLGGFSAKGGVETKVWLLKHEGAASLLI
jgi:methylated-DNA-[protein]-cysteine S-methyltransferase